MHRIRLAIFVITFLAFARLTACDFTFWDDQQTIHQNPRLNPPTWNTLGFYWTVASDQETMGLYIPVTYTVWSGLAKLAWQPQSDAYGNRLNPAVFHTANVLLHATTALVVFQLLLCLFGQAGEPAPRRDGTALCCAVGTLVFALHPVQVESVGWVSGTKDLLCGLLSSAALLMYVRSVQMRNATAGLRYSSTQLHRNQSVVEPQRRRDAEKSLMTPDFGAPPPSGFSLQKFRSAPLRLRGEISSQENKMSSEINEEPGPAPRDPALASTSEPASLRARVWSSRWRYLLATLLFILAMLSKPTAVVTPLMALVIAVFLLDRPLRKTIASLLPWFVLVIPFLIWTRQIQPASWVSPLSEWAKPAVAADAIAFYLCKIGWPIHLCIDYSRNPSAIAASGAIYFTWILPAAIAGWLWWKRKQHPPAVAAAFLFLMPLLPLLGFVPFEFQYISTTADHYLYLPMLGVAILVTWLAQQFWSRRTTLISLLALAALAMRSILQEPTWQDTRSLDSHALEVNPHSAVSYAGLGLVASLDARRLSAAGQPGSARPLFEQSIRLYEKSLECDPLFVPSRVNLALAYQQINRLDLARQEIDRVIAVQPQLPPGLRADPVTIANYLIEFQDFKGAAAWLDGILRRDPNNFPAQVLRQRLGRNPNDE